MHTIIRRAALAASLGSLALAAPAAAHITTNPSEAPSDGDATVSFQIRTGARSRRPRSSASRSAERGVGHAGRQPKLDDQDQGGQEGPRRAPRQEDHERSQPGHVLGQDAAACGPARLRLPEPEDAGGRGGRVHLFPTVQKCEQGETRWIEIPAEGESEEDLEEPAPAIALTAAEGEHGGARGGARRGPESEQASAEVDRAGATVDDDSAPEWLTIVALVLGRRPRAGVAGLTAARRHSA